MKLTFTRRATPRALIQEGKTVVYVARQAGHTPGAQPRHYARLFRDAPTVPVPADVAIRQARRGA